jgi:hypothetical protein
VNLPQPAQVPWIGLKASAGETSSVTALPVKEQQ